MNAITRGIRGAGRNAIRAFAIIVILGVSLGLSLVMLVADKSIGRQIENSLSAVGTTVKITQNDQTGMDMSAISKIGQIPHVQRFNMSLDLRVPTTGDALDADDHGTTSLRVAGPPAGVPAGRQVPPSANQPRLVGLSNPTDRTLLLGAGAFQLTGGHSFNGLEANHQALLSTAMATANHLTVGSTFTAYNEVFTVAGLYQTDNVGNTDRRLVIVSLPTIQRLAGKTNLVAEAAATVDSLRNLQAATTAIRQAALSQPSDVTSEQEQAEAALQPLVKVRNISRYSLVGAVVGSAIIILLTMIMIVRERRREIGILKAIGLKNSRIITQYTSEALTFTLSGAVVGIVIGALTGGTVAQALVTNAAASTASQPVRAAATAQKGAVNQAAGALQNALHITAQLDWGVVLFGLSVAVLLAILGSMLAALFIAKVRPAEVLRSE